MIIKTITYDTEVVLLSFEYNIDRQPVIVSVDDKNIVIPYIIFMEQFQEAIDFFGGKDA